MTLVVSLLLLQMFFLFFVHLLFKCPHLLLQLCVLPYQPILIIFVLATLFLYLFTCLFYVALKVSSLGFALNKVCPGVFYINMYFFYDLK